MSCIGNSLVILLIAGILAPISKDKSGILLLELLCFTSQCFKDSFAFAALREEIERPICHHIVTSLSRKPGFGCYIKFHISYFKLDAVTIAVIEGYCHHHHIED